MEKRNTDLIEKFCPELLDGKSVYVVISSTEKDEVFFLNQELIEEMKAFSLEEFKQKGKDFILEKSSKIFYGEKAKEVLDFISKRKENGKA